MIVALPGLFSYLFWDIKVIKDLTLRNLFVVFFIQLKSLLMLCIKNMIAVNTCPALYHIHMEFPGRKFSCPFRN